MTKDVLITCLLVLYSSISILAQQQNTNADIVQIDQNPVIIIGEMKDVMW